MDPPDNGNRSLNHALNQLSNGLPAIPLPQLSLSGAVPPQSSMAGFSWPFYYPMASGALFPQTTADAYSAQLSAWAFAVNGHGLFLPPAAMAMASVYGNNTALSQYSSPVSSVPNQPQADHNSKAQARMPKKKSSTPIRRPGPAITGGASTSFASSEVVVGLPNRRLGTVASANEIGARLLSPATTSLPLVVVKCEALDDRDEDRLELATDTSIAGTSTIKRERREKSPSLSETPARESIVVGDYSNPFEGSQSKMRDAIDLYRFLWLMDDDCNAGSRPVYRPFLLRNLCYMQRRQRRKSDNQPSAAVPRVLSVGDRPENGSCGNGSKTKHFVETPKNLVKDALHTAKLQPQRYVTDSGESTGELLATTVKFNFIRNNLCFGDRSAVVQCYHATEVDCRPGTVQRIPSTRFEMRVNEKLRHVSIYLPESFGAEFCIGQQSRSEHFIVKVIFRYADSEVGGGKRLRKMASRERPEDRETAGGRRRRSNEPANYDDRAGGAEEVVMFGTKPIVSYSKEFGLSVLHGETSIVLYSSSELNVDPNNNDWTRNPSFLPHIQRLQRKTFDNPFMSVQVYNEGDDDDDDDDEEDGTLTAVKTNGTVNDKADVETEAANRCPPTPCCMGKPPKNGRPKPGRRRSLAVRASVARGCGRTAVARKRRRGPSISKALVGGEPNAEEKRQDDALNTPSTSSGFEDQLLLNATDDVFSRGEMALPEMIALRFENVVIKSERKKSSSGAAFFGVAPTSKAKDSQDFSRFNGDDTLRPSELPCDGKIFASNSEIDEGSGGSDFEEIHAENALPPTAVVRVLKTAQLCFFCLNRLAFRSLNGMAMHLQLCHSRLKFAFEENVIVSKNLTLPGFIVTMNSTFDVSNELDPMRHYIKHGSAGGLTRIRHITVPTLPIWIVNKQISRGVRRGWTNLERSTKQAELYNSSLFKDALMTGEIRLGARYTFQPPTKIDQQWIVQANYRKLGEITDLHPCEQAIMQMWNEFLLRIRITLLGHNMVYKASRVFVDEHRGLINDGGLRVYFLLHLVNLSNIGCITDEESYDLFQRLDSSYNPLMDDVHCASRLLDTFNRERVRSSYKRSGDVTACRTGSASNLQQLLADCGTPESGGGSALLENCARSVAHFESFDALRAAFPTASIRRLEKLWRFLDIYTIASFKMI